MRIGLVGYGKMGKEIEQIALERGHQIAWKVDRENPLKDQDTDVDMLIEFTRPEHAVGHIKWSLEKQLPIVVGTTGWNSYLSEVSKLAERLDGSLLHASNFSVGVNIFFRINELLARLMTSHTNYRASIEEIHHTEKIDAPSGTAISLANGILSNNENYLSWVCGENEIPHVNDQQLGVTAYRVPNVPGTHKVEYKSAIDTIEIKHEAHSRKGFALGAVLAAEWLQGKKGVYTMRDVLKD
ncbi:MAG: 4-hydroxy-tetrahydrodipicolinate reductase [Bacteroidetes bacterium]|nr:MAG: 4-hydroxy-tetrahydrodipicolinate reductase [Bacteroidota bacterium]